MSNSYSPAPDHLVSHSTATTGVPWEYLTKKQRTNICIEGIARSLDRSIREAEKRHADLSNRSPYPLSQDEVPPRKTRMSLLDRFWRAFS